MSEHTHPSQYHEHRHFHLRPYFAGIGPGQEWQERFIWHSHPHNHPAETHDHTFRRSDEEEYHDRFAHIHDHGANEPAGRVASASTDAG